MKIYKGKKRLAKKHNWAFNKVREFSHYKPGDIVSTCCGFNVKIDKIEYEWRDVIKSAKYDFRNDKDIIKKCKRTKVISDIIFYDTKGRSHFLSGPGCVWHKETYEKIMESWNRWALRSEDSFTANERSRKLRSMILNKEPIIDENGICVADY